MKEKIIFDFEPVLHFDAGGRRYACNPRCNTNEEKFASKPELVTCKSCKAYMRRMKNEP